MISVQHTMQAGTQKGHEDLANLFARHMTFNPEAQAAVTMETAKQESMPVAEPAQPVTYSISQHYHHSAHILKPSRQQEDGHGQAQASRRSSEPPTSDMPPAEAILRSFGVDPAVLTPSQMQLFRVADEPQKLRLLELWSICPPNKREEIPELAWSSTSIEQEEHLARLRYERQQSPNMMLNRTSIQNGDGSWTLQPPPDSEPYMLSGYSHVGDVSYSRATDPVYKGLDYQTEQHQLAMASQYGAFEQFRAGTCPAEAMEM